MQRPILLAILTACLALGCARREQGDGRGVLVVAIDGLRADHLSAYGYDRPTSPTLDALAEEGTLFEQTFSTAPAMIPAHVSLLTGCHPAVARRRVPPTIDLPEANLWAVPHRAPRLAMRMLAGAEETGYRAEGFATAAFIDTTQLPPSGKYDAGFQVYDHDDIADLRRPEERGVDALGEELLKWVRNLPDDRSWFAYLHLHDLERAWRRGDAEWDRFFEPRPELAFVPPVSAPEEAFFAVPRSRWRSRGTTMGDYEAHYDGAIRRVDEALGELFRGLEATGRWDDTTVSVVGTHGIQLGEAGLFLSGGLLSVADLHVPWILRPAPSLRLASGQRSAELVSLVDVAPTHLELAGLAVPDGMHGRSLAGVLRGESGGGRDYAFASWGKIGGAVVFGERWALEQRAFNPHDRVLLAKWFGTPEPDADLEQRIVFDRIESPYPPLGAPGDEGALEPEVVAELKGALEAWQLRVYGTWAVLQDSPLLKREELVVERLRELGYLGAGE